jgi:hypothetical protein
MTFRTKMPQISCRSTRLWGDICIVTTLHSTSIAFFSSMNCRSKFHNGTFLAHVHGIACWSPQKRIYKHPVHRAWYCSGNCSFGFGRFLLNISACFRPSWGFKYAFLLCQAKWRNTVLKLATTVSLARIAQPHSSLNNLDKTSLGIKIKPHTTECN